MPRCACTLDEFKKLALRSSYDYLSLAPLPNRKIFVNEGIGSRVLGKSTSWENKDYLGTPSDDSWSFSVEMY